MDRPCVHVREELGGHRLLSPSTELTMVQRKRWMDWRDNSFNKTGSRDDWRWARLSSGFIETLRLLACATNVSKS